MKKIFLLLISLISLAISANAQTVDAVSLGYGNTISVASPTYGYIWGTSTRDTLVASDTIKAIVRLKSNSVQDVTIQLSVTKVSGTVTNKFYVYGSMNGTSWGTALDSITNTNASTGTNTTVLNLDDFSKPFIKIEGIAGATAQKAWYKLWWINRNE